MFPNGILRPEGWYRLGGAVAGAHASDSGQADTGHRTQDRRHVTHGRQKEVARCIPERGCRCFWLIISRQVSRRDDVDLADDRVGEGETPWTLGKGINPIRAVLRSRDSHHKSSVQRADELTRCLPGHGVQGSSPGKLPPLSALCAGGGGGGAVAPSRGGLRRGCLRDAEAVHS